MSANQHFAIVPDPARRLPDAMVIHLSEPIPIKPVNAGEVSNNFFKPTLPAEVPANKLDFTFQAPQKDMADEEIIARFVPAEPSERTAWMRKVSWVIDSFQSRRPQTTEEVRAQTERAARCAVVLTKFVNFRRSSDAADDRTVRLAHDSIGTFMTHLDPYITTIARGTSGQVAAKAGMGVDDLKQAGQTGVWEALGRYDLGWKSDEVPFMAFAKRRIFGAMIDSVREGGNTIRLSIRDLKFAKEFNKLLDDGMDEVAAARQLAKTPEEMEKLFDRIESRIPVSLSEEFDDKTFRASTRLRLTREYWLIDPDEDVEELALGHDAKYFIPGLLEGLPEREAEMVKMRFGIEPFDHEYKLQEIANQLGFTESRAAQIISKVLIELEEDLRIKLRPKPDWQKVSAHQKQKYGLPPESNQVHLKRVRTKKFADLETVPKPDAPVPALTLPDGIVFDEKHQSVKFLRRIANDVFEPLGINVDAKASKKIINLLGYQMVERMHAANANAAERTDDEPNGWFKPAAGDLADSDEGKVNIAMMKYLSNSWRAVQSDAAAHPEAYLDMIHRAKATINLPDIGNWFVR